MDEMIEKLKDKNYVRVFGLMTKEEQDCFKNAGSLNCIFYNPGGNWFMLRADMDFARDRTYAIKPDYKPEPKFVDLEVVTSGGFLGVVKPSNDSADLPFIFTHLHCLPSLPGFKEFWYYREFGHRVDFCCYGKVAPLRDRGETVFARFRSRN